MDDLGRAAVLSLAPAGDPALKAQAAAYCEQIKASPEGWMICIQRFMALDNGIIAKPDADLIRFFCLHVIEETVKNRYVQPWM